MSEAERKDSTEYKDENEHKHSAESQGEGEHSEAEHSEAEHSEAQHGEAEHGDVVHEPEFPQEYLGVLEEQIEFLQKRLEVGGLRETLRRRFLQKLGNGEQLRGLGQDEARLAMVLVTVEVYLRYSREQWEELGWWERAKAGDRDARTGVYVRNNPDIMRFLKNRCRGTARDPKDISQTIWVRVLGGFPAFRGHELGEYISWLWTIVHHETSNVRRNKWNQVIPVSQMEDDEEAGGNMGTVLDMITKNRREPAISPEILQDYKNTVERMPPQERRIWDLHCEGHKAPEIVKRVAGGLTAEQVREFINKVEKHLQVLNPGKGGQK